MQYTPNFNFLIPEGTDTVNLLTQCYPNFTSLDTILQAIKESGITEAVTTKVGTVHNIVRNVADCNVIRWVNTANYAAGDTFTVDGSPVTATTMDGQSLPAGAFVINQSCLAILNGSVLTFVGGGGAATAAGTSYDNTGSGLTATDVQAAIDELKSDIPTIPASYAATAITYDNTVSGLTATDVQAAIDELKALIPTHTYTTAGLQIMSGRCSIMSGGYYIENNRAYFNMTISILAAVSTGASVIQGLPQGYTTGVLTPTYNNLYVSRTATNTYLTAAANLSVGETLHFEGSYALT